MEEHNYREVINEKLALLDLGNIENTRNSMIEYLEKIEKVIHNCNENRKGALKSYKDNKLSILKISKESKIARQTIYNNREILERYINKSIEVQKKQDLFEKIESLNNNINGLKGEIFKLQLRDVTIENQLMQIEELNKIIKNNNNVIENLNIRNQELISKVSELSKELSGYKIRVREFK